MAAYASTQITVDGPVGQNTLRVTVEHGAPTVTLTINGYDIVMDLNDADELRRALATGVFNAKSNI